MTTDGARGFGRAAALVLAAPLGYVLLTAQQSPAQFSTAQPSFGGMPYGGFVQPG